MLDEQNIRYSTHEGWGHYLLRDVTREEYLDFSNRVPERACYHTNDKENGLLEIVFHGIQPEEEPYDDFGEFDPGDPDYIAEMYEFMLTRRYEDRLEQEQQEDCHQQLIATVQDNTAIDL